MSEPENDVERAFQIAHLGMPETVAYFQELREAVLCFLMPYEPGLGGIKQIGNGSEISFVTWTVADEVVIPVFTSHARVQEALQAAGKWQEKNTIGEMIGLELLHIISLQPPPWKVAINPGCLSGSRTMDEAMVTSIVDGSALHIPSPGEVELGKLVMSLPNRQPARLRDPLTSFLKGCPEVKAAWLFREIEPAQPYECVYVLGLIIAGNDAEELKQEAALALAGACPPEWNSHAWLIDPQDPGLTETLNELPPFYAAPDFVKPVFKPDEE